MGIEEHLTLGTVAVIVALMMNLMGLVWGASKFASSVARLEDDIIPQLMQNLARLTEIVQVHDKEIAVIKALHRKHKTGGDFR